MALSSISYLGDDSQVNFNLSFPYLNKEDVDVYIDGELINILPSGTPPAGQYYIFLNDSTIQFQEPPALNAVIELKRTTKADTRLVDFVNGSRQNADDFDLDSDQLFYLIQENADRVAEALSRFPSDDGEMFKDLDMNGYKIINLGDPEDGSDAVNKDYVDEQIANVEAGDFTPNTVVNLGAGLGLYAQTSGTEYQFKSIVAGDNVDISEDSDEITISADDQNFVGDIKFTYGDQPSGYFEAQGSVLDQATYPELFSYMGEKSRCLQNLSLVDSNLFSSAEVCHEVEFTNGVYLGAFGASRQLYKTDNTFSTWTPLPSMFISDKPAGAIPKKHIYAQGTRVAAIVDSPDDSTTLHGFGWSTDSGETFNTIDSSLIRGSSSFNSLGAVFVYNSYFFAVFEDGKVFANYDIITEPVNGWVDVGNLPQYNIESSHIVIDEDRNRAYWSNPTSFIRYVDLSTFGDIVEFGVIAGNFRGLSAPAISPIDGDLYIIVDGTTPAMSNKNLVIRYNFEQRDVQTYPLDFSFDGSPFSITAVNGDFVLFNEELRVYTFGSGFFKSPQGTYTINPVNIVHHDADNDRLFVPTSSGLELYSVNDDSIPAFRIPYIKAPSNMTAYIKGE